jgi:hypothetical protein
VQDIDELDLTELYLRAKVDKLVLGDLRRLKSEEYSFSKIKIDKAKEKFDKFKQIFSELVDSVNDLSNIETEENKNAS